MVNILEGGRDLQETQEKLASTADVIVRASKRKKVANGIIELQLNSLSPYMDRLVKTILSAGWGRVYSVRQRRAGQGRSKEAFLIGRVGCN